MYKFFVVAQVDVGLPGGRATKEFPLESRTVEEVDECVFQWAMHFAEGFEEEFRKQATCEEEVWSFYDEVKYDWFLRAEEVNDG